MVRIRPDAIGLGPWAAISSWFASQLSLLFMSTGDPYLSDERLSGEWDISGLTDRHRVLNVIPKNINLPATANAVQVRVRIVSMRIR